ncbi:ArnT family glycosyltransferase [Mitsuokella sp.]|uniref:ArnT family glycosyltransferase n=1 Tax=unclassified Mitsuokella TaxID=2637239 RepID=UPI003D7CE5A9
MNKVAQFLRTRQPLVFLLALIVLVLAGNGQLAITDPVESNYALTAKEMLASGDYISPRIYGNYWYDKPIFFYWELLAAFSAFGVNEFAARFFPAVFSVLNVLETYYFARKLYDKSTALLSALIFGTTTAFFYLSKAVITDMTFVFFFNAVLIAFFLAYRSGRRSLYVLAFLFSGLTVLTKGPIGFLLPGFILLVFLCVRRRPKELLRMKWFSGMAVFLLVGGSWYYVMYRLHGMDFIDTFFGVHNFLRARVAEHARDDVWFYYILIFLLGFLPWSFVVLWQVKKRWQELKARVKERSFSEGALFLFIWALLVHLFFQCMATKYVTYTQPAFLPMAILAGRLLKDHVTFVKRLALASYFVYFVLLFAAAIPLCAQQSGRDVAAALRNLNPEHHLVVNYGDYNNDRIHYRTSTVFYYGENIPELIGKRELAEIQPGGMSWNAKNVMPFLAYEDLPPETTVYILCETPRLPFLRGRLQDSALEVVDEQHGTSIVKAVVPARRTEEEKN